MTVYMYRNEKQRSTGLVVYWKIVSSGNEACGEITFLSAFFRSFIVRLTVCLHTIASNGLAGKQVSA